jgi:signal transduction histidine kinase
MVVIVTSRQHAMLSWWFLGAVAVLSLCLGVLQYRWLGEVSRGERERLRGSLQSSLNRLAQEFNTELTSAVLSLTVPVTESDPKLRQQQYAAQFFRWKESAHHEGLIRGIWLRSTRDGKVSLEALNLKRSAFEPAEWPDGWDSVRERIEMRAGPEFGLGRRMFGAALGLPDLILLPRMERFPSEGGPGRPPEFGEPRRDPPARPSEWLLVQLDLNYIRNVVIPELLERHLAYRGNVQYQAAIVWREDPATVIYESARGMAKRIGDSADASVHLMEIRMEQMFRRRGMQGPGPPGEFFRGRGDEPGRPAGEPVLERGRWILSVRHNAGSLEAVVAATRWRNLIVMGGLLGLILIAAVALVRFTRRAQMLADLQMEFVAGISHELRTPLSVMRTAGHNLRGRVSEDPLRVQRYGALVEQESQKLGAIVEQVLRFASAEAGRAANASTRVPAAAFLEEVLDGEQRVLQEAGFTIERQIARDLPDIWVDSTALGQAVRNLITNALKYGSQGRWIRVAAEPVKFHGAPAVSFRIADRGPGIPREELAHIFDPFYRGKRAVDEQIHGTGLGLSLARRIVEAHGGTLSVRSEPGKGAEFLIRIPAAPAETPPLNSGSGDVTARSLKEPDVLSLGDHGSENSTG